MYLPSITVPVRLYDNEEGSLYNNHMMFQKFDGYYNDRQIALSLCNTIKKKSYICFLHADIYMIEYFQRDNMKI